MIDVLIVKTSSLGDVVHALPVLSDIQRVHPDWKIAWMVEESLQAIPRLHPFCAQVIPVATRRWRKSWFSEATKHELKQLRSRLKEIQPHYVLDLQGLIKSALLAKLSPGLHLGYRWGSARENLATLLYDQGFAVSWKQHAVERNRKLAAGSLDYSIHETPCDYGLFQNSADSSSKDAILIHSSSWQTKLWPEESWIAMGQVLSQKGLRCVLPSGSPSEWERAQRLVQQIPDAIALPPGPLADCIGHLAGAHFVVGVDTGLTHLSTAFNLPTVALYRVTDPAATGVFGSDRAMNLGGKGGCPSVDDVLMTLTRLGCFSALESA
jgi:heptosyltransferase-1